jgi:hypothetical protein
MGGEKMKRSGFILRVVFVLLWAGQAGCVVLESERYTFIDRHPVEEPRQVAEPAKTDEAAWYSVLVEIADFPVAIVHEVFSGLSNLADSIGGSVVQIRKGVVEKKVTYRRFTFLNFKKRETELTEIEHKDFQGRRQEK